ELVLSSAAPIDVTNLPLKTGQVVRAAHGSRAVVRVPAEGWRIEADETRFKDIDFVATSPDTRSLIELANRRAEFHGCSWQAAPGGHATAAIEWTSNGAMLGDDDALMRGELRLSDCLMQQVGCGVRWPLRGSVLIELANVLHLGPGALVEYLHAPGGDEAYEIIASHLTLRDASALAICECQTLPADPGRLIISAKDCAFIPAAGSGLVMFRGAARPGALLSALEWMGQGSVLARDAAVVVWCDEQGRMHPAADDAVQVAGLVRSDVGFAGEKWGGPSASRIVRWQVPLESTDPPGIRESKPIPTGALR
ncbi:MAG TPA: hypothetical protein VG713_13145, partial [Pirellulales bacterium]|nr:hypothetical protein [Pirellulales bacterium]